MDTARAHTRETWDVFSFCLGGGGRRPPGDSASDCKPEAAHLPVACRCVPSRHPHQVSHCFACAQDALGDALLRAEAAGEPDASEAGTDDGQVATQLVACQVGRPPHADFPKVPRRKKALTWATPSSTSRARHRHALTAPKVCGPQMFPWQRDELAANGKFRRACAC